MSTTALIIIAVVAVICVGIVLVVVSGGKPKPNYDPVRAIASAGRVIRDEAYNQAWGKIVTGMANIEAENQAEMIAASVPRKPRRPDQTELPLGG